MQRTKKQLLGLGGLALVAAMTTVAYSIPVEAVNVSGNAEVVVMVYSGDYETKIETPLDGSVTTNNIVDVENIYSHAHAMHYTLTHVGEDGDPDVVYPLTDQDLPDLFDVSDIKKFTLNLNDYGGYGHYILTSIVTGGDGATRSDAVEFDYVAAKYTGDETATNNDPIIDFDYSAGIGSIEFTVYDKNGNPVFSDAIPYIVSDPTVLGSGKITLPFANVGAESGDYYIVLNAYTSADLSGTPVLSGLRYDFNYVKPKAPEVPDTGALLSVLNISRADFTVTCLVAFVLVTLGALVVMRKNKTRR